MDLVTGGGRGSGVCGQAGVAFGVDVALVLVDVFIQDEGDLAPAVAVVMLEVLKEAVVEAGWGAVDVEFLLVVLAGHAFECAVGGEGGGGEGGDTDGGFVVIADGGLDSWIDFGEGAFDLEVALGDEFLNDGGAEVSGLVGEVELTAEFFEVIAGEGEGGEELGAATGVLGDGGGNVFFEGFEAAFC